MGSPNRHRQSYIRGKMTVSISGQSPAELFLSVQTALESCRPYLKYIDAFSAIDSLGVIAPLAEDMHHECGLNSPELERSQVLIVALLHSRSEDIRDEIGIYYDSYKEWLLLTRKGEWVIGTASVSGRDDEIHSLAEFTLITNARLKMVLSRARGHETAGLIIQALMREVRGSVRAKEHRIESLRRAEGELRALGERIDLLTD